MRPECEKLNKNTWKETSHVAFSIGAVRALSEEEQKELQKVSRATSEAHIRHQRARALLVVSAGKSLSEAARLVGWKSHEPMTKVTRRFNTVGLVALDDLPRPGHIEPTDQNNKHAFCKKLVGRQIA